ncbi:hypothetical protein Tco_0946905 [Tanacetum coccineum]
MNYDIEDDIMDPVIVILFSIHNDEWKSFQCHHQTALRSYALSWKPCQGDSLNLPDHRIHKDGDGDASFQLKSDSLPHAHAQSTKTFYKHQDSRIMKAQELKTKTSAQTLILKITPQKSSFGGDLYMIVVKSKYVWGDEQDEAFRILKEKLYNAPVLALPDGPDDFVVYCIKTWFWVCADAEGQSNSVCVKTVEDA